MLTASQREADHVSGLEHGADDFVVKPVAPPVLLARIRSHLRRIEHGPSRAELRGSVHTVGSLSIDLAMRDVTFDDQPVGLTTMEFDVLAMLAIHAGCVVEREDLYSEVAGIAYDGIDRGMDVHVSRIRRKLERCGFDATRLKSVRGVGYLLAYR